MTTIEQDQIIATAAEKAQAAKAVRAENGIAKARDYAQSWDRVAAFLAANPAIAEQATVGGFFGSAERVLVSINTLPDPVAYIVAAARAATEAGGRVEEKSDRDHGGVELHFGQVNVFVYADRDKVCEPVVVGTVPDVKYRLTVALDGITEQADTQTGGAL